MSYTCPACGREEVERRDFCPCGADLSLLATMEATLDAWFNEGLTAAEAADMPRALEWFAACVVARPTDVQALALLARVWHELGYPLATLRLLDRAAEVETEGSDRAQLRALAQAARPGVEAQSTVRASVSSETDCRTSAPPRDSSLLQNDVTTNNQIT